jgi:hypothetical protein
MLRLGCIFLLYKEFYQEDIYLLLEHDIEIRLGSIHIYRRLISIFLSLLIDSRFRSMRVNSCITFLE